MKTSIKNLIATTFVAIVLTSTAFAADEKANSKTVTVLNDVKNFNKVKVSGNVELILVQSINPSVKVYDNYYSKNALVQEQNGELFISSFEKEPLTVVAYVNNLSGISASDNATVSTFGNFNLLGLDIKLQNNASANIGVNAINLTTNISGNSNLTLSGSATEHSASIESIAKVNMDKFKADQTSVLAKNTAYAKTYTQDSLDAGLERLGK